MDQDITLEIGELHKPPGKPHAQKQHVDHSKYSSIEKVGLSLRINGMSACRLW